MAYLLDFDFKYKNKIAKNAQNEVKIIEISGFRFIVILLIPILDKIANPTPIKDSPAISPDETSNPL